MLVVPAVVPIPENSSQSTNFSKLINLSSGFEVKQRRFFCVFGDARDRGQWFWKGFGGNNFGMGYKTTQLREHQTEKNLNSHMKAPCSIHVQSTI